MSDNAVKTQEEMLFLDVPVSDELLEVAAGDAKLHAFTCLSALVDWLKCV